MGTRIEKKCIVPGCEGIATMDTTAYWDVDAQQWKLNDITDQETYCCECGCELHDVEIKGEPEPKKWKVPGTCIQRDLWAVTMTVTATSPQEATALCRHGRYDDIEWEKSIGAEDCEEKPTVSEDEEPWLA